MMRWGQPDPVNVGLLAAIVILAGFLAFVAWALAAEPVSAPSTSAPAATAKAVPDLRPVRVSRSLARAQILPIGHPVYGKPSSSPPPLVVVAPDPPQRHYRGGIGEPWRTIAACESGGDWHSTAGMFDGGLQFLPSTWTANGGGRYAPSADRATAREQIRIARRVLASSGWGAWPVCSRRAGLR